VTAALCPERNSDSWRSRTLTRERLGSLGLLLAGALSAMLTSCGTGTTVLPSGLQSGGSGFVTITSATLPDAIAGRAYTAIITTNVTGIPITCTVADGSLPAAPGDGTVTAFGDQCQIKISKVQLASAPATIPITIQAASSAHSNERQFNLTIRQDYSFVQQTELMDGVQGRTYGVTFGGQPFSQPAPTTIKNIHSGIGQVNEVGNGPIVCSLGAVAPQAGSAGNPGLAVATDATGANCLLESAGAGALTTAGAYSVTIQAMDSPIPDPNNPGHNAVAGEFQSITLPLTVHPPLRATLTQGAASNPADLLAGVVARSYGVIGGAPTYAASGGLGEATHGVGPYLWCVASGSASLPAGLNGNKISTTCGVSTSTKENSALLQTAAGATIGSTGTFPSIVLQLDDSGNTAVPNSVLSRTAAPSSKTSLIVEPALSATFAQNGATSPANLLNGVINRSYGVANNGAGSAVYNATGGLGAVTGAGYGAYRWCVSSGSASLLAGLNGNGISTSCGTTASTIINTAVLQTSANNGTLQSTGTFPNITLRVDDPGNSAVPDSTSTATFSTPSATSIRVFPEVSLSVNLGSRWPPTVSNRAFGAGSGCSGGSCAPAIYTASGGLGGYVWPSTTPASFPAGFSCPAVAVGSATYTCSANPVTAQVSSATTFTPTVTVSDTPNAAVPADTAATDPGSGLSSTVSVSPQISLTVNLGATWPNGVDDRNYGVGGNCGTAGNAACTTPTYSAAGGLGGYVWPSTAPVSFPTGFSCPGVAVGSTSYKCSAQPVSATDGAKPYQPAVTITDTPNGSTPAATVATDPKSTLASNLQLNSEVSLTSDFASPWPDGVTNRPYGSGVACSSGGCTPLTFTAANGLGGYVFTSSNFPVGLGCAAAAPVLSCSGTKITGGAATYSPKVTVTDTPNATTPAATTTSDGTSAVTGQLTVEPQVTLSDSLPSPWPAGVNNRRYGTGSGCSGGNCVTPLFSATGGLPGNYTFTESGFPPGFVATPAAASVSESANPVMASGSYSPMVSVTDTANQTTPAATTATDPASTTSAQVTVDSQVSLSVTLGSSWPKGVIGRSYGVGNNCGTTGTAACSPPVYSASGGLSGYTYTGESGFPSGFSYVPTGATLTASAAAITGTVTGPFSPSVTVTDSSNSTTPAATVVTDPSSNLLSSLTLNAEMTITVPSGFPAAVVGRRYGTGTGCTGSGGSCAPLTYTVPSATPGLGTYTFTANNFPANFTCPTSSNNGNCQASSVGGSAGTPSVTVTVTDTANASTPSNSITSASANLSVDATMALTPPSGTLATAVAGRAYGQGSTCGAGGTTACASINYTISGGLGTYQTPGSITYNTSGTFSCPLSSTTYECSTASVVGSGSQILTMTATETGNASTPSGTASDHTQSLPTNAAMALTPPSGTLATAVTGRSYGQGSTCGAGGTTACTSINYTIVGGLGNYQTPGTITYDTSATFGCPLSGTTYECSTASVVGSGSQKLTMTATETGNASTPSGTATNNTKNLPTNAAMTLTPPSGTLATAVTGRSYGQGSTCGAGGTSACTSINYTIAGGLGNYQTPGTITYDTSGTFSCPLSSTTYQCSTASVVGSGSQALTMIATETGNTSTPGGTASDNSKSLPTNAAMTLTPPSGTLATAVTGRSYGQGSTCGAGGSTACTGINYTISGGLGNYQTPATITYDTSATFGCPLSGTTYECSTASVMGSGSQSLKMTATETANASTPGATATDSSKSLPTDAALALPAPTPSPIPDAVTGRTYGAGSGCGGSCAPLAYSPTGGLTPYKITGSGFPAPISCAQTGSTLNCTGAAITGSTSTGSVSVTDTANASTPGGSASRVSDKITVDPEITIANTSPLSNGQLDEAYSVLLSCEISGQTVCGGTGNPDNALAMYTWSASSNNVTGVTLTTTTAIAQPGTNFFSGTPTTTGTSETVTLKVQDDGNLSTPSCNSNSPVTCPSLAASVDVFPSLAFVGSSDFNGVLPVTTSTSPVTPGTKISLPASSTPTQLAVSPNATDFFVVDPGLNQAYVIDSQSDAVTGFATGADPQGVAVGPQKAPGQSGFDANSFYAYVANATADNVQVIDGDPSHTSTFGTLVKTIDFTLASTSSNPVALVVTPTVLSGTTRETRLYVIRQGADEACVIDAEPTSATFLTQVSPATGTPNGDKCIPLAAGVTPEFVATSPDGLYTFVTEINGGSGQVEVIDTEAGSSRQDQMLGTPVSLPAACAVPEQPGVTVDGQTLWVPCGGATGNEVVPITTAEVGSAQFTVGTGITPTTGSNTEPQAVTFRPDGALALVTLSAANELLPITLPTAAAAASVSISPLTAPAGITHIPNASLHITTLALPAATHGKAYESSVVAAGGTQAYTFIDVNGALATLDLTLSSDGKITGSSVADSTGSHNVVIEVDDSSTPVVNKVQKTVALTIN
jgi:hypothetical protein